MGCGAACERNYSSQPRHYPTALPFDLHFLPNYLFQTVDLALYTSSELDNIPTRDITASDTEASQPPHRVLAQSTSNSNRSVRTILCEMDPNQAINHAYTPFSQPTEIRVAIIEPSIDREAPLQFSFHQARLEELEGRYEAVSYVWGAPILTFPVHHIADGSQIFVTENLDHVLRSQRQALVTRWLWADAICIDQRNDREKEVQIPLMIDIYRGAKRVLAWLHQGDEAVERGMRCIDRISRNSVKPETVFQDHGSHCSKLLDIIKFINLTYFRRLWIVQEVVFNLDITFICGKRELSWIRLAKGLNHIQKWSKSQKNWALGHEIDTLYQVADLWKTNAFGLRNPSHLADPEHILDLVINFGTHRCTDDRDRIYAVHSLAHERNAHMPIDYSWDVYETYHRFALKCMADGRTVDVLSASAASLHFQSCTSWPSWMPDWRCMPDRFRLDVSEREQYSTLDPSKYRALSRGHGPPIIRYIREVSHNTIELKCPILIHENEDGARQPLTAYMKGKASMGASLSEFLSAVISLYRRSVPLTAPTKGCSELFFLLHHLWSPRSNPQHIDYAALRDYLELLWKTPKAYTEAMRNYEQLLQKPMAASTAGLCFFRARSRATGQTLFCCGRAEVIEDDILMISGWGYDLIYAFILRASAEYVKDNSVVSHQDTWRSHPYKIIGEAWVWKTDFSSAFVHREQIYIC
jgi:hypothetical protein